MLKKVFRGTSTPMHHALSVSPPLNLPVEESQTLIKNDDSVVQTFPKEDLFM